MMTGKTTIVSYYSLVVLVQQYCNSRTPAVKLELIIEKSYSI